MQYQVPQFIEVEDKIFGPLTLKQFIYVAGGGGLCLAIYTLLPLYLAIPLSLPVAIFSLALAFYQINGRPFIIAMEHAVGYFFGTKLYLWKQRAPDMPSIQSQADAASRTATSEAHLGLTVPKLSNSKLKDLSWSLNIKDRQNAGSNGPEFQI